MSDFVQKPMDDATDAEKATFARTILNLDIPSTATPAEIDAAIRAAQPGISQIFVQRSDPAADALQLNAPEAAPSTLAAGETTEVSGTQQGSLGRTDPRVVINIAKTDQPDGTGSSDVGVGVNGVVWQIKRGVDVPVPIRVLFALNNCEQDIVTHDPETFEVHVNASRRFPLTMPEGPPRPEDVREWYERTKDQFCP